MALLEGKTPTERNKMIAAAVLGLDRSWHLWLAFGRNIFGGRTTTAATTKKSPTPTAGKLGIRRKSEGPYSLPNATEQDFTYQTTPVVYNAGNSLAPDPGRNIFAFYEPPPPTPYVPTPVPLAEPINPPTPTPTPVFLATFINPPSVYAGSADSA